MPLDNTSLFRARVKTIQMRQAARAKKERGDAIEEIKFTDSEPVDGTFCLPPSSYSIYSSKAEEIRRCLIELRDAVVARRQDYIATVGHCRGFALSTSRGMCEWERNELDDESERAIRQCSQLIRSFERQIRSDTQLRASDEAAHLEGVARILESYLRKIAKIITELRSVRVRKTAEMKKMIRLSTLVQIHKNKLRNEALAHEDESNGDENQTKLDRFHRETSSNSAPLPQESTSGLRKRRSGEKGDVNRTTKEEQSEVAPFVEGYRLAEDRWEQIPASTDEPLSEEERVQMVAENEKLYAKLAQVDSDILRIEKQMNQIHRLQETFAEKVLDQERDINFVSETTVHSVENIREGNEQIRQAIQNMASRRVILLFCIIVLTFTLLFLDWYNP